MRTRKSVQKLSIVVLVILLVSIFAIPASALGTTALFCNANSVHVRTGPDTGYSSYGFMNYSDIFQSIRVTNGWAYGSPDPTSPLYKAYGYTFYGYTSNQYYYAMGTSGK